LRQRNTTATKPHLAGSTENQRLFDFFKILYSFWNISRFSTRSDRSSMTATPEENKATVSSALKAMSSNSVLSKRLDALLRSAQEANKLNSSEAPPAKHEFTAPKTNAEVGNRELTAK
jgi:hypothetical protein